MEKQSLLYNQVVYVAMPKRLFDDDIAIRALRYIKTLKPLAMIDPRGMFKDNTEWARRFPGYLKPCQICVVVTDNNIIGKGVYEEVKHFDTNGKQCYLYVERDNGNIQTLVTMTGLHVVDWNNWIDYARVEYA